MITLFRADASLELSPAMWDALQLFAKQEGWQPAGAVDIEERRKHSIYCAGRFVLTHDAARFGAALKRVVNSETADELDLAEIVGLVNFLHGGAFVIR